MKKFSILLFLNIFIISFIFNVTGINPVAQAASFQTGLSTTAQKAGFFDANTFQKKTPQEIIALAIRGFLGIIGVILLVLLIYGGFVWMKSRGNESDVKKAQDIIRNATIGIIIVLAAYAISDLIWTKLFSLN